MSNEVEPRATTTATFRPCRKYVFCAIALVSIAALCARLRAQPVPRNAMIYLGMEHRFSESTRRIWPSVEGGGYSNSLLPLLAHGMC